MFAFSDLFIYKVLVFEWLLKMVIEEPEVKVAEVEPHRGEFSLIHVLGEGRF